MARLLSFRRCFIRLLKLFEDIFKPRSEIVLNNIQPAINKSLPHHFPGPFLVTKSSPLKESKFDGHGYHDQCAQKMEI